MNQRKSKTTKTTKRNSDEEMIFEVYRILTPASQGNFDAFDGFNDSEPFTTTEKKLSEVCAQKFGGGQYVAFQLSESHEGDPLSYWVIKVRDREHHNSMRVYPREDLINIVREERRPSSLNDFLYGRNLAMVASLCLKELEEPKARGSKETPQVAFVRSLCLRAPSLTKAEVVKLTIKENKTKKWWDPNLSEEAQESWAKQAYASAQRANRKRREARKANREGWKTRRT